MSEFFQVLSKLRNCSLDEWRIRGLQVVSAWAEEAGWSSLTHVPDDISFFSLIEPRCIPPSRHSAENLLDHFCTRTRPRFFSAFADRKATISQLQERFGASNRNAVIERAGRIGEGRFDLLGLKDVRFGQPINWHLEPISGVVAPRKHWSRIPYLNADHAGDKKIIWELNRHQYFGTLGRAYWYTGDESYAKVFISHLESWSEENAPKVGINWASSLEVALRSISWLWAFYFFQESNQISPTDFLRMLKLLYLHGRHLETYLSTYFSPNTHLTGEALGLFYLGTLLPEFSFAERWRRKGQEILLAELARHVRCDGVYFEQSTYYHRYTTDFYSHFLILLLQNEQPVESFLRDKLQALLDHIMYITRPDGTTPLVGDDDGGRLVMLDEHPANDFRNSLATGAVLFARPDYKYVATELSEETLWLLGPRGAEQFDQLDTRKPEKESVGFEEGGYYVMRDGWSRDSNYLLMDCGPHGSLRFGHAHADALSFDLAARGRTLLVDPGTYTYTGSAELRNYFRSSRAHNTLTVDRESSSVPDQPFSWKQHVANASVLKWISHPRFDYFQGSHDGYQRLSSPVTHYRSVLFLKGDYWIVHDHLETTGSHDYDLYFHFVPEVDPTIVNQDGINLVCEQSNPSSGLQIFAFAEGGRWHREQGKVSYSYASFLEAAVFRFSLTATGAQDLVSVLIPHPLYEKKRRVHRIAEGAFEILGDRGRDAVLVGSGQAMKAPGFASDFRMIWARFAEKLVPDELVLVGGTSLTLFGRELVRSSSFINYAVLRRQDDALHGEIDKVSNLRLSFRTGD